MNQDQSNQIVKQLTKKYNKICFLLPVYKIMDTKAYMSMVTLIAQVYKMGFEPTFFFLDQTNILIARNELAGFFNQYHKDYNFDLVVWMDSDHYITLENFMQLLYHYDAYADISILSARYITRDVVAPKLCAYINEGTKEDPKFRSVLPTNKGISEVDAVGFGCIMMQPKVMLDMYKKYAKHQFQFIALGDKEQGGMLSEDLLWCMRAQELGYKVYLDNDVEIGHMGGIINTNSIIVSRMVQEAKNKDEANKNR